MTVSIHCPKCGRNFDSTESYQNHLPCQGSKLVGGSGDVYIGTADVQETESGTGGGRP